MKKKCGICRGMNGKLVEGTGNPQRPIRLIDCVYCQPWKKVVSNMVSKVRPIVGFVLDTSGSMSPHIYRDICKIMDKATEHAEVHFIQWTTKLEHGCIWDSKNTRPKLQGFGGTELAGAVKYCHDNPYLKRSSEIFVISDCMDINLQYLKPDSRFTFLIPSDEDGFNSYRPKQFNCIRIPIK